MRLCCHRLLIKIRSYNDDHIVQAEVIPVVYDKKFGDSFDDADLVIGMNYYLKKFDKEEILSDKYVTTLGLLTARYYQLNYLPLPYHTHEEPLLMSYPFHLKRQPKNRWLRKVVKEVCNASVK